MGKYLDMVAGVDGGYEPTKETNYTNYPVTSVVADESVHNQREDFVRIVRLFRSFPSPNARPDLQLLVAAYGGYGLVPAEAWTAFETAVADWQERVRRGDRYLQPPTATTVASKEN